MYQHQQQESREYFRVEDLLPTSIKKIDIELAKMKGKTIPGLPSSIGYPTKGEESFDESVNPAVWRMLVEINRKLTILLDDMHLGHQGLNNIEMKKVSLSASGMRAACTERFAPGDFVEIKILLTANTSYWVIVNGKVVRATQLEESRWEVAIEFLEMGDEVNNALSTYMINRQRETINKNE
jgi:hypothetical protein